MHMRALRIVCCLLLFPALGGCALLNQELAAPEVRLAGVVLEYADLRSQRFRARLALDNPNQVPVRIAGAGLELAIEGRKVGEGRLGAALELPAGGAIEVDMLVTTNLLASAGDALSWILAGRTDVGYEASGYVDLGRRFLGRIPLRESGRIELETGRLSR